MVGRVVVWLVLSLMSATGWTQWTVKSKVDSMTDAVQYSAEIVNADGHSLSLHRIGADTVWLNFSLAPTSADTLSPRRGPMYRVDKYPPNDLDHARKITETARKYRAQVSTYFWEPKWVNVYLGSNQVPDTNGVAQYMVGKAVVVRYYLGTGGSKDTAFTLNGAGVAISKAIGIPLSPDLQQVAEAEGFKIALWDAEVKCAYSLVGDAVAVCTKKVKACAEQFSNDYRAFQQCVQ